MDGSHRPPSANALEAIGTSKPTDIGFASITRVKNEVVALFHKQHKENKGKVVKVATMSTKVDALI